jgi:hypothetical protein
MRRLGTALLLAAALAGAAGAAAPADKVLAVEWRAGGGQLRWVSARTLQPTGGPVVDLGGAPANLVAVSPDGRTGALGGGENGRLRLIDLARPRSLALLRVGEGYVFEGIWPTRDRLVLLLGGMGAQVAVVDPTARRVVSQRTLHGTALTSVAAGRRLLALLAPRDAIGAARLAVIDAKGSVRTVALPGIQAGIAPPRSPEGAGRQAAPGLAASPDGSRAAVVSPGRVVEVDLETLKVTSRALVVRTSSRATKRIEGWSRAAIWAGDHSIAVTGSTDSYDGGTRRHTPMGLSLLDVRTGAAHLLDRSSTQATRVGTTLVGHGGAVITGYRPDGTVRFELLDHDGDSGYLQQAGGYLYVGSTNSTRFVVVDAEAGRIVGRARTTKPTSIIGP